MQAKDSALCASYSSHLNQTKARANGKPMHKAIKHAHFNEEWVMEGDKK